MAQADANALHRPVLVDECLDLMAPAIDNASGTPVIVDATLGMGGHSEAMLERFEAAVVVGIDRDPAAISLATERLAPFGDRFRAVHTTYDRFDEVAAETGAVNAILMDLGVSSLQLDERERGFSYAQDAPLDMRMDPTSGQSAAELLATIDERELTRILRVYGEEKFASRIAKRIVSTRESDPLTTTAQLATLVKDVIPAPARRTGGNPAKRTFQAIRIAVNRELEVLEAALPKALEALAVGGRLVVESYHSLEDRLVKHAIAAGATSSTPPDFPVEVDPPWLKSLTRGAIKAPETEQLSNPRSASVRLRACEKISEGPRR